MSVIKEQKGFGLIQVLVLGSLLTAAASFMLRSNSFVSKALRSNYYQAELYMHTQYLEEILVDHNICREILRGRQVNEETYDLTHSLYGDILKVGKGFGHLNSANAKKMFKVDKGSNSFAIKLEEGRNANHLKLKYNILVNDNIFGFSETEKTIHLFMIKDNNNAISDCFFDPLDDSPDDGEFNGLISSALRKLCAHDNMYDETRGECYIKGFNNLDMPGAQGIDKVIKGITYNNELRRYQFKIEKNPYNLLNFNCNQIGSYVNTLNHDGAGCTPLTGDHFDHFISHGLITCATVVGFGVLSPGIGVGCR